MVHFKVTDGVTTRRFLMKTGELCYTKLRERLAALFPEAIKTTDDKLHLYYTDSEGDQITISSDAEFQEALTQLPADATWKLHIRLQIKQQVTPSQNRSFAPRRYSFMPPARRLAASYNPWLPFSHHFPSMRSSLWDFPSWSDLDAGFEEALHEHDQLFEALRKGARVDYDQKQETSENASSGNQSDKENDGGNSNVSGLTENSFPGLRVKKIGSWEPQEHKGPFGRGTVIGPVGYHVSWTSGSAKEQDKGKREEANAEEKRDGRENKRKEAEEKEDSREVETSN